MTTLGVAEVLFRVLILGTVTMVARTAWRFYPDYRRWVDRKFGRTSYYSKRDVDAAELFTTTIVDYARSGSGHSTGWCKRHRNRAMDMKRTNESAKLKNWRIEASVPAVQYVEAASKEAAIEIACRNPDWWEVDLTAPICTEHILSAAEDKDE